MKKIPTVYVRDRETGLVTEYVTPGCEWVFDSTTIARRKYDGTCCLVKDGILYKRRTLKKGKTPPDGFEEVDYDENTGKRFGWVKCTKDDVYHMEAFEQLSNSFRMYDGTYELCGPKIQGNPKGLKYHILLSHCNANIFGIGCVNRIWIVKCLNENDIEGLVFWGPGPKLAKIKQRDFGFRKRLECVKK